MRLATIRTGEGTKAVRLDDDVLVDVGAPDVGALLAHADWAERARAAAPGPAATYAAAGADYAPVVPQPSKVICVGLQGKTWDSSTPVGPYRVSHAWPNLQFTPDDLALRRSSG